ncbi:hypothetical protein M8J75_012402 [Diaphorina citri]|nr:hypothetical protein M8J75_012402 [Diaphorina citri]
MLHHKSFIHYFRSSLYIRTLLAPPWRHYTFHLLQRKLRPRPAKKKPRIGLFVSTRCLNQLIKILNQEDKHFSFFLKNWIRKTLTSMKTEDLSKVRIAVLGKVNVGKSALTVRYLTRRFIGEYRSNADLLYRQTVTINNSPLEVEIIDVSGETRDSFPSDQICWADGCIIVYSLIDKESFDYAVSTLQNLQRHRAVNNVPVMLLANKLDLEHLRQVDESLGRSTAVKYNCTFHEVSVADNSPAIYQAFDHLLTESRGGPPSGIHKIRKFSVTKMLGTLIGGSNKSPPTHQGGTVVVCNKSDLCRSRVLKRRQFLATPATSL